MITDLNAVADANVVVPASTAAAPAPQSTAGTGGPATSGAPTATAAAARPATYHELKAALPGADAAFLTSQLEANATVTQAQAAFMSHLAKQNAELQTKLNEQTVAAAAAPLKKPGVAAGVSALPANSGQAAAAAGGDSAMEWDQKLSALLATGMSRARAVSALIAREPELHKAFISERNGSQHQREQLAKRFS